MIEPSPGDPRFRRFNAVVTFVICAAVAGAAARYEHQRRKWWGSNHPLTKPKAGIEKTRVVVRNQRANLGEVREGMGSISEAVRLARAGGPGAAAAPVASRQRLGESLAGTLRSARSRDDIRRAARARAEAVRLATAKARDVAKRTRPPRSPSSDVG